MCHSCRKVLGGKKRHCLLLDLSNITCQEVQALPGGLAHRSRRLNGSSPVTGGSLSGAGSSARCSPPSLPAPPPPILSAGRDT
jgi:hypothetical protein